MQFEKYKKLILESILKEENIRKSEYTLELGGMCPCGIGMDYVDNVWYTYSCERNEKFGFNKHNNFDFVAYDFIKMLATDSECMFRMLDKYNEAIERIINTINHCFV